MQHKQKRWINQLKKLFLALLVTAVWLAGCGGDGEIPWGAVEVNVVANTSLTPWLETAVAEFNASETETSDGTQIFVTLTPMEAGQAVVELSSSAGEAALWIPDETVWVNILADRGNSAYQSACASVAESPLVIGMWRPVAEALGWPGRALGWLDVGSLAADPSAWAYYSGGQFGDELRLGHTHPGLSGSGTSTLLALVQAAESKQTAVTTEDIEQPIVQAFVGSFEGAVSWFSASTTDLGQTMAERGVQFLGAAVMYESDLLNNPSDPALIPIYPFEGTFVATFPACINTAAPADQQEAAEIFRAYLLSEAGQTTALQAGNLRPVNAPPAVSVEALGIDPNQPEIVFASPTVETVYAVQNLWQAARKDVNLVMLIDVSGSMRGDKLENVQAAAVRFVEQMGEDDFISIIAFADQPLLIADHVQAGAARADVIESIRQLFADGNTSLYDAIGEAAAVIDRTTAEETANAMVVLSDGQDTSSVRYQFDASLAALAADNDTTVFTIAYGSDAEEALLADLARQANGNFYLGDEASIATIYDEMSAAFGGSAGIGR